MDENHLRQIVSRALSGSVEGLNADIQRIDESAASRGFSQRQGPDYGKIEDAVIKRAQEAADKLLEALRSKTDLSDGDIVRATSDLNGTLISMVTTGVHYSPHPSPGDTERLSSRVEPIISAFSNKLKRH